MTQGGRYRPELDGLRALSALAVVGFHVSSAQVLRGGSIGVTVFFVLSGYLITGLLLDELEREGGVDLRRFYIRRGARLLPAMLVVTAVGVAVTLLQGNGPVVARGHHAALRL